MCVDTTAFLKFFFQMNCRYRDLLFASYVLPCRPLRYVTVCEHVRHASMMCDVRRSIVFGLFRQCFDQSKVFDPVEHLLINCCLLIRWAVSAISVIRCLLTCDLCVIYTPLHDSMRLLSHFRLMTQYTVDAVCWWGNVTGVVCVTLSISI